MRPAVAVLTALAVAGCGEAELEREATASRAGAAVELPPLPEKRQPRVVQPEAGIAGSGGADDLSQPATGLAVEEDLPKPNAPASVRRTGKHAPAAVDGSVSRATALPNGVALPPLEAPAAVLKIIEAGNAIARSPYKWGGGHGRFLDDGYDCSGSVSFALYAAGLIEGPRTSGGLLTWGEPGPGKWVTIYTHPGHVYMEVAGIRFDTSGARKTGSRWQNDMRPARGFEARHPPGL